MKYHFQLLFIVLCAFMAVVARAQDAEQKKSPVEIHVTGISGDALKNVTDRLDIKKKAIQHNQSTLVKWRFYQEIPEDTMEALKPYGYFRAKVSTSLTRHKDYWDITVKVAAGERLEFTNVHIKLEGEGLYDPAFINYLQQSPVEQGKPFDSEQYEQLKDDLQNIANTNGYFEATFVNNQLIVNLNNYTSSVEITYNTGERYHFGKIHFSPSIINESLLKRYLTFDPGDLYNNYLLEESRKNLTGSGYFSQVNIKPDISGADNHFVPINIALSAQHQVTYTFGAGYGTDTGIRGMAASHIRWLNASGHSLNMQARGSQHNDQIAASYNIPGANPATDSWHITGGLMDINQVTGQAQNAQTGVSYQTKLGEWQTTVSLNYLIENYTLNNFPNEGQNTKTDANVLYPQLTLQRIYAKKNLINPDYGYNLLFSGAAGNNFKSNNIFSQTRADVRTLYTVKKTHTRILARASVGSILIDNLTNLPLSMQFYAGGAQSIRGYEYNSIGPGTALVIGSVELQQKIVGNFYLGGFVDAGNVSDDIKNDAVKIGTGPALVYLSPVGAIELSFGHKVGSDSWLIQFSIGTLL